MQDIFIGKMETELQAMLKEAESASCSVELLLPLFKNTVEGINLENVSVELRIANKMESEPTIQNGLTKDSHLNGNAHKWGHDTKNGASWESILISCHY